MPAVVQSNRCGAECGFYWSVLRVWVAEPIPDEKRAVMINPPLGAVPYWVCCLIRRKGMDSVQGRVMVGSSSCSRRRRWVSDLRSSPDLGRMKVLEASLNSSLKLVERAEIQTWRTGVLGVTTNLLEPSSKMMFMTPLLSSNSKRGSSVVSAAAMRDCLRASRERSDWRRKVASSIMDLVYLVWVEGYCGC